MNVKDFILNRNIKGYYSTFLGRERQGLRSAFRLQFCRWDFAIASRNVDLFIAIEFISCYFAPRLHNRSRWTLRNLVIRS